MPHRDPDTGKFVPSGGLPDIDRFEEMYFNHLYSVPAADVDGSTDQHFGQQGTWEGFEIPLIDDVIDRDELAVLVWAEHRLSAYITSTQTADGTVRAIVEVSTDPSRSGGVEALVTSVDIDDTDGDYAVEVDDSGVVSGDVIGRPVQAIGHGPITDGATGVGGSGSAGDDWWEGRPFAVPTFDGRDTLYTNGVIEQSNVADAALHADLVGRHVYGVIENFF